jgi:hypothetical protein
MDFISRNAGCEELGTVIMQTREVQANHLICRSTGSHTGGRCSAVDVPQSAAEQIKTMPTVIDFHLDIIIRPVLYLKRTTFRRFYFIFVFRLKRAQLGPINKASP